MRMVQEPKTPNGPRVSGERSEAKRVRCTRMLGSGPIAARPQTRLVPYAGDSLKLVQLVTAMVVPNASDSGSSTTELELLIG